MYDKRGCEYCDEGEIVIDGKCKKGNEEETGAEVEEEKELAEGECKYDSDCAAICEGNTMWKMGCNAQNNSCEKTFDTDCITNMGTF